MQRHNYEVRLGYAYYMEALLIYRLTLSISRIGPLSPNPLPDHCIPLHTIELRSILPLVSLHLDFLFPLP